MTRKHDSRSRTIWIDEDVWEQLETRCNLLRPKPSKAALIREYIERGLENDNV
jgi:predicted CopG family antitoxin